MRGESVNPDEIMLRNTMSGKDSTPVWDMVSKPLTSEELAALDRHPSPLPRLPDPQPFISVGAPKTGRNGIEVTVGLNGTF